MNKTQPQKLLEEIIPRNEDEKFPTIVEQQEYWQQEEERKKNEAWERLEKEKAEFLADEAMRPPRFSCAKCDRTFTKPEGLRMHDARVHTRTILTPGEKPVAVLPQNPTHFRKVTNSTRRFPKFPPEVETLDTYRRKWSLTRRRKFNARKKLEQEAKEAPALQERIGAWHRITPPLEEEMRVRFCPCCGRNIERFLT